MPGCLLWVFRIVRSEVSLAEITHSVKLHTLPVSTSDIHYSWKPGTGAKKHQKLYKLHKYLRISPQFSTLRESIRPWQHLWDRNEHLP